ncbi:MAG: HAD family hydrolase [Candidatus Aenigmarchaeota archaeon]|nr:HAD family hydrolase [Candidatus Aenigmarchaeota archaeon]
MPVKAVLIDLDNTLYEYEKCNKPAVDAVIEELSIETGKSKELVKQVFDESRKKVKVELGDVAASHSRFLYFQKTIEALKGKTDIQLTEQLHDLFWNVYFEQMELYDGVIDFFEYLKQNNIKIAIVSDLTVELQFKKLIELGVDKYIDFVITSEESGREKPDKSIFLLSLDKLGCDKDDVIFIGDDLEKDIKGAENFGMRYIHVKDNFGDVLEAFKNLKAQSSSDSE